MPGKSKTSPESIERRKRMAQALQLRETGANYRQIALALDISISTAHEYVTEAMKELTREPAESVLQLELSRLDAMFLGVWKQASRGNLNAVDRALKIMERRSKFVGLDHLAALRIRGEGRELSAVDAFHASLLGDKAADEDKQ